MKGTHTFEFILFRVEKNHISQSADGVKVDIQKVETRDYTRCPVVGHGGVGDMGVVTLLLLCCELGPKVVKADMDLLGELAQMGPTSALLEVSMTMGVVSGV